MSNIIMVYVDGMFTAFWAAVLTCMIINDRTAESVVYTAFLAATIALSVWQIRDAAKSRTVNVLVEKVDE